MRRARIRPAAEADVEAAFRWYESRRAGLGYEFMQALEACLDFVQRNPGANAVLYRGIRRALLRRFPYGVFYLWKEGTITVLAVLHARRDPGHWKTRTP